MISGELHLYDLVSVLARRICVDKQGWSKSLHRFDVRHGFRQRAYQSKRAADVGTPLGEISPCTQRAPRPNACEARSGPF